MTNIESPKQPTDAISRFLETREGVNDLAAGKCPKWSEVFEQNPGFQSLTENQQVSSRLFVGFIMLSDEAVLRKLGHRRLTATEIKEKRLRFVNSHFSGDLGMSMGEISKEQVVVMKNYNRQNFLHSDSNTIPMFLLPDLRSEYINSNKYTSPTF